MTAAAGAPQPSPRLVLASGSAARRRMLETAGLAFSVHPADVDEASLRDALMASDDAVSPGKIAAQLASEKAKSVSRGMPGTLVIGSDQVLSCDGTIHSKPGSLANARTMLQALRGRTHELHSAVAVAEDGTVSWCHTQTARLTMRPFSDSCLDSYLKRADAGILACAGSYQVEGLGVTLFEAIDGDHFTILGLPLVALLNELRRRGEIPA